MNPHRILDWMCCNLRRAELVFRQDAMTSAQSMKPAMLIAALAACVCACNSQEKLQPPSVLFSPYNRPQIWAVAPLANESGVSTVRTDQIADALVEQIVQTQGLHAMPLNRVFAAMRKLQIRSIASPMEANALMIALQVDGLIVGTVTAYDPYSPLKLGAAVQLYHRDAPPPMAAVDPVKLTRAPTELVAPAAMSQLAPTAQAANVFDASNHQTLAWLDEYAAGRIDPGSAYGQRIYLVNMELYTQFVAYRLLHDLLESERARLMPVTTQPTTR
jgi:hypothetical protein